MVAVGTHVYGGRYNTASLLGRYGNPIQDYIGALEVPLADAGQINMVPVGEAYISQANAATGPQVNEITKLGDNVVVPTINPNEPVNGTSSEGVTNGTTTNRTTSDIEGNKPEFWIFEGAEEIFKLTKDFASTIGPMIAGPIGAVILPTIVEGIKRAQPGNFSQVDVSAALQRALLANSTLVAAEQRAENSNPEGLFDTLKEIFQNNPLLGIDQSKPEGVFDDFGIRLPFKEIMGAIGVATNAADQLVNEVAAEITRGLLLRAKIPSLVMHIAKPESAIESSVPACNTNEKDFVEQLAKTSSSQPEGIFGDMGKFFDGVVSDVGNVVSDSARLVGNRVVGTARDVNNIVNDATHRTSQGIDYIFGTAISESGPIPEQMAMLLAEAMGVKKPESAFDESKPEGWIDILIRAIGSPVLTHVTSPATGTWAALVGSKRPEGAFDELKPKAIFDTISAGVRKISQALILNSVIADQFLTAQMARPAAELKAEGFFSDVGDFFSNKTNVQGVINIAGHVHPIGAVVAPILGVAITSLW